MRQVKITQPGCSNALNDRQPDAGKGEGGEGWVESSQSQCGSHHLTVCHIDSAFFIWFSNSFFECLSSMFTANNMTLDDEHGNVIFLKTLDERKTLCHRFRKFTENHVSLETYQNSKKKKSWPVLCKAIEEDRGNERHGCMALFERLLTSLVSKLHKNPLSRAVLKMILSEMNSSSS